MITIILTVYRGGDNFPLPTANNKRLFQLFERSGVYDQQKIDAGTPHPKPLDYHLDRCVKGK